MTWTYDTALTADRDKLRLKIGDTDTSDQQLQDEELDFFLSEEGSVNGAAVSAVKALIAKFSRAPDKRVGDLSISYSDRIDAYKDLLEKLEGEVSLAGAKPFAGGISRDQKDTVRDDTDRVSPRFSRDKFRHPGTVPDDDDEGLND